MKHSKTILVACISAFVAITTAFLGVTGTIIGSVISSVLYNVLSDMITDPIEKSKFEKKFEWDIAYVFPLAVILFIQFLLIFAFLSEWGILPSTFLSIYLNLQNAVNNNLYRIMGLSLIVMSIYPFVLKPDAIKKFHGALIGLVAIIFLGRGFLSEFNSVFSFYAKLYSVIDFPLAIIAFIILFYTIVQIISNVKDVRHSKVKKAKINSLKDLQLKKSPIISKRKPMRTYRKNFPTKKEVNRISKTQIKDTNINTSAEDIEFVSNDLLEQYKRKRR